MQVACRISFHRTLLWVSRVIVYCLLTNDLSACASSSASLKRPSKALLFSSPDLLILTVYGMMQSERYQPTPDYPLSFPPPARPTGPYLVGANFEIVCPSPVNSLWVSTSTPDKRSLVNKNRIILCKKSPATRADLFIPQNARVALPRNARTDKRCESENIGSEGH